MDLLASEVEKHSPEKIVEILHSIVKLEMDGNELNVYFDGDENVNVANSFLPQSFTRELLELIEDHLAGRVW